MPKKIKTFDEELYKKALERGNLRLAFEIALTIAEEAAEDE